MTVLSRLLLSSVALGLAGLIAPAEDAQAQQKATLTAIKADAAPKLDGVADDAVWQKAAKLDVNAAKGVNFGGGGATTGTLRAVYMGDMLYMLVTWKDPTQSFRRSPFVKKPDGTWEKMKDPNDKGGDNNTVYEDKMAMIWNIKGSIFGFDRRGCQIACHAGEPGKPYGNKYTEEAGELGDIWHLKGVRTGPVGQIDDQYLDNTKFDAQKAPEAGRKSDPRTGGGYEDVKLEGGKPAMMSKDGKPANKGGTYWIKKADAVPFEDKFQPGDEIASIIIAPFEGDRGDIKMAMQYKDGEWVIELSRSLVTKGQYDVQFDNLDGEYAFGIAFFDNAQVRHAYDERPLFLKFQK